jgi:hypothetical protein
MKINVAVAPPPAYRWPDMDDLKAFRKLQAVKFMSGRQIRRVYGPDLRGLIPVLFRPDGTPRFHNIGLTYRDGVVRAAHAGHVVIDLDDPTATPGGLRRIFQPSHLNAVLMMGGIAEEAGAAAFAAPNENWFQKALEAGVERDAAQALADAKPLTGRCNAALMAELYRGVTPAEATLYATLRSLPISLRHRSGWLVDPRLFYELRHRGSQLIDQYPLSALQWSRIQQAATVSGAKLKEIADNWGFARSTTKIPAAALSVINYRLDVDGRDEEATAAELEALDNDLCDALPEGAFRGKLVVDLVVLATLRGLPPAEASAFGRWAAPYIAKLTKESELPEAYRVSLADRRAAAPDALAEAGDYEPWRDSMTLIGAIEHARQFITALADARTPNAPEASPTEWPAPAWSIGDPPAPTKGRSWFPYYLGSRDMLRWGGSYFRNCAASYASDCASGISAIYAIVRRPTKTDKPGKLTELPGYGPVVRGAMLELRKTPAGRCRRAQLLGVANTPEASLPSSLTNAAHRWIAERNDPRNHNNIGE